MSRHTVCPPAMTIACATAKAAASENSNQSSGPPRRSIVQVRHSVNLVSRLVRPFLGSKPRAFDRSPNSPPIRAVGGAAEGR